MIRLKRPLILGSGSPRRQFILREAGFEFEVRKPAEDETFPRSMPPANVAVFLAEKKAMSFRGSIADELVITADTVVILNDLILNKPADKQEAMSMLAALSGKTHTVVTGVSLLTRDDLLSFDDATQVTFKELTAPEIEWYIEKHQPYDKAGSYGAQDWIGMVGIERISGSYFNVMGLPMHKLYTRLLAFAHSEH